MKDNEKKVQIIEEEEIITLYDENDNPVDFYEVAVVEYEDEFYALLQPAEDVEGIADDEVIICKLEEQDDDTDLILPVNDEELLEKIFNEYLKEISEEGCGCGCGEHCHHEDGECNCHHEDGECDCHHEDGHHCSCDKHNK